MSQVLYLLESVLGKAHVQGKDYLFTCPFHGGANDLRVTIETDREGKNMWHCFSCNKGGHTIRHLFKKIAPDKVPAIDALIVPKYFDKIPKDKLPTILTLPVEFKHLKDIGQNDHIGRQALAYVNKRGFNSLDILKYNLGYCEEGKYRNRIIFPSYDANGKLNYFIGRTFIKDAQPRYLPCDFPRKDIVPLELFINWKVPVILCEGFFDAKAIARNAIPLMEKGISPGIMKKLLSGEVKKVYIALDKDALKSALDHADTLIAHGKEVYLVELEGKDPSEMGFEAFTKLIQTVKSSTRADIMIRKLKMALYE
jgi:DNA primase